MSCTKSPVYYWFTSYSALACLIASYHCLHAANWSNHATACTLLVDAILLRRPRALTLGFSEKQALLPVCRCKFLFGTTDIIQIAQQTLCYRYWLNWKHFYQSTECLQIIHAIIAGYLSLLKCKNSTLWTSTRVSTMNPLVLKLIFADACDRGIHWSLDRVPRTATLLARSRRCVPP